MKRCFHSLRATTSERYVQCELCGAVFQVKNGTLIPCEGESVKKQSWQEAERAMLNQRRKPKYADDAKAERDLKRYWSGE